MSLPAILERIAQIDQIVAPKPKPPASTAGGSVVRLPARAQLRASSAAPRSRRPAAAPAVAAGTEPAAPGPWPPPRARSASPSSRPAPTTARRSPSTAPPPRAAASARGAPTSPRGPRRRPASRSARPDRASARSAPCTAGRSAPAAPRPAGPGVQPNPGDLIVWGGQPHRHRGVRRRRRLDPHHRGQLLQRRLAAHLRARRRRRHGLRAARLSPARPRAVRQYSTKDPTAGLATPSRRASA